MTEGLENLLSPLKENVEELQKLDGRELQIIAKGNYPTKKSTPVQDVSHYQNDGTTKGVTPSRFVERAEADGNWEDMIAEVLIEQIFEERYNVKDNVDKIGKQISKDIMDKIDRIKTGQLKRSMIHKLK